jgi:DNA primase
MLYRLLIQRGFTARETVESGLCLSSQGRVVDRFRGRLMFPIKDLKGRTVGFGGRALEKVEPKYMNSPETPIYVKRDNLYALEMTRRDILKEGFVILVEGYTDVLGLYQGGVRNVAATLGTALTTEHFRQLSRFTDRVVLAFDADAAGVGASERSLDFYLEFDLDLRVVSLPGGMDPADFMKDHGREDFVAVLDASMALPEFCIRKVLEASDLSDPNARTRAITRSLQIIAGLERKESSQLYLRKLQDLADVDYDVLLKALERILGKRAPTPTGREVKTPAPSAPDPVRRLQEEALRVLLSQPALAPDFRLQVGEGFFTDPAQEALREAIAAVSDLEPARATERVFASLKDNDAARNLASSLIMGGLGNISDKSQAEAQRHLQDINAALQDLDLVRQIKEMEKRLRELVRSPDRDHQQESEISLRLTQLERERFRLKGRV